MKYLVIGVGGTGAPIAAHLKNGGADVSVIARGEHLKAIKANGLTIKKSDGTELNVKIDAYCEEEYGEKADVIFVTVKSYSVDSVIPLVRKAAHENTVVIPLLNVFTTGEYLSEKLPELYIVDGTMYIVSSIKEPGVITMNADIFKVIFGERKDQEAKPVLDTIAKEMRGCRIFAQHTPEIRKRHFSNFPLFHRLLQPVFITNAEQVICRKRVRKEKPLFLSSAKWRLLQTAWVLLLMKTSPKEALSCSAQEHLI